MNLERIAKRACFRCHVESIARKLVERRQVIGSERGTPLRLVEIAELWQCSISQVSRCLRGLFTTFDGLTFEFRLRTLGSDLKEALADREQIARAVVEATVAAALQARGIPKGEWSEFIPLSDSSFRLIRWIVANRPLPDMATTSIGAWEKWFGETLEFSEAESDESGQRTLPERDNQAVLATLAAGDWMAFDDHVKFYIPFQIAAFIVFYSDQTASEAGLSKQFEEGRNQTRRQITRFHALENEIELIRNKMRRLGQHNDYGRMLFNVKLSALYRQQERYSDGLMCLYCAVNNASLAFVAAGIPELRQELNEYLSIHAANSPDFYLNSSEALQRGLTISKVKTLNQLYKALWPKPDLDQIPSAPFSEPA